MKFGFILTNLAGGGAEKTILTLGAELTSRGNDVTVILLENLIEHVIPSRLRVQCIVNSRKKIHKGFLGKRLAAYRLKKFLREMSREQPFDLVVSALPFANEIAIMAGISRHWCRIDNTLSAEIELLEEKSKSRALRRRARYQRLYSLRPLITVSDGVTADLKKAFGLTRTRIERIYNPFDFDEIRRRAADSAPVPVAPYVIHVGRFVRQKRHDVLLDAWMQVRAPHRLVLLTAPDERLDRMIRERGLQDRVLVAGFQANPYPWIAAAKLLVLSSDHEGLPSVIIEALSLGTPVVSTDCPSGPREILGPKSRDALVPVGDPDALARAIDRMLADSSIGLETDLAPFSLGAAASAYEKLAKEPA